MSDLYKNEFKRVSAIQYLLNDQGCNQDDFEKSAAFVYILHYPSNWRTLTGYYSFSNFDTQVWLKNPAIKDIVTDGLTLVILKLVEDAILITPTGSMYIMPLKITEQIPSSERNHDLYVNLFETAQNFLKSPLAKQPAVETRYQDIDDLQHIFARVQTKEALKVAQKERKARYKKMRHQLLWVFLIILGVLIMFNLKTALGWLFFFVASWKYAIIGLLPCGLLWYGIGDWYDDDNY